MYYGAGVNDLLRRAVMLVRRACSLDPWRIETFVNGKFRQNCYLAIHQATKRAVVIDPGGDADAVAAVIEEETNGLDAILLTHGHFDHIGGVDFLASRFKLRARAHFGDRVLIRQASIYASRLARQRMRPPTLIDYFESMEHMVLAGEVWRAHFAPGHTKGSVCFETRGLLFVGDAFFFKSIPPASYPESDDQQIQNAVSSVLSAADSASVIFSGHGRPWSVADARAWWFGLTEVAPTMNVFTAPSETEIA
jgi:hydroxyacylglutathione hydrolase